MQGIDARQLIAEGYFEVPEDMWADISAGDKIRYTLETRPGKTFGGLVKFVLVDNGQRKFRLHPDREGISDWVQPPAGMSSLWKRYAAGTSIEFKLITISLLEKKKAIASLEASVKALEEALVELRARLSNSASF